MRYARRMVTDGSGFNGFAARKITGMVKQQFVAIHGGLIEGTGDGGHVRSLVSPANF